MDAETKEKFKWKFYLLTVQLNAVILLVALLVLAFIWAPEPYRIPLIAGMSVLLVYLAVNFSRWYKATKAWLDQHAGQNNPE